ncbi:hypothetical protein SERLA73DRAFT_68571 [Serpula lacrymans var. lacrymans S7.3]|uniref:Uncharacterized protein n=2 Tax=Serpula lacrymans var. lacrymans TaxID=341189 RepID=F8PH19_SERL3|nr:uncharacterized protein SERLADRAFT_432337 [Serpula lacrymans var. lacrymans S7.9]EGO04915.1 hypothetical protein SERLA73DRAFT_68571 [Serpula lacrymans var. lacrymans S7.3]EGO30725.1 hypothetical protein SERLADRAFT_432337 [Serpula lacrymans var. lacrymans S7.9]
MAALAETGFIRFCQVLQLQPMHLMALFMIWVMLKANFQQQKSHLHSVCTQGRSIPTPKDQENEGPYMAMILEGLNNVSNKFNKIICVMDILA